MFCFAPPFTPTAALLGLLASPGPAVATPAAAERHRAEVESWRREREAALRAPDGWLAVVGLTWLHAGANRFGSAPDDEIRMPAPAPAHAGALIVDGAALRAELAPGSGALLDGKPPSGRGPIVVRTDAAPAGPSVLGYGGVSLQVIARGGRFGARVKDRASAALAAFAGLDWFPIDAAYRVSARLEPGGHAGKIVVPDASGGRQELDSPGTLAFTLRGRATRLVPVADGPDAADLLVVFRDATSGGQSYGGGRFVRARRQPDGGYEIDFNRAYSPPCAFTPYATCPLPPPENRLAVAIPAGEKQPPGARGH